MIGEDSTADEALEKLIMRVIDDLENPVPRILEIIREREREAFQDGYVCGGNG